MPYKRNDPDSMILRDHLAYDRTVLANERTFLAYFRTSIMVLATAVTFIKIFPDDQRLRFFGYSLLFFSPLLIVFGIARFLLTRKTLKAVYLPK